MKTLPRQLVAEVIRQVNSESVLAVSHKAWL